MNKEYTNEEVLAMKENYERLVKKYETQIETMKGNLEDMRRQLNKKEEEGSRYFREKQDLEKYKTAYDLLTERMTKAFADSLLQEAQPMVYHMEEED